MTRDKWSRWNRGYRAGYRVGRAQRRAAESGGCRRTAAVVLVLVPTAAGLAGWGAGALIGVLT